MGAARKYCDAVRDKAVALRMQGWSPTGIADQVGLSSRTVNNLLNYHRNYHGVEFPPISRADRPAGPVVVRMDMASSWALAHNAAARQLPISELARLLLVAVLESPVMVANLLDEDWPPVVAEADEFQTVLERAG